MIYHAQFTMESEMATLKVELNKIVLLKYKDPDEPSVRICISDKKPDQKGDIIYISPQTPIAKAILNHMEGEEVDVVTPGGTYRIQIHKVV